LAQEAHWFAATGGGLTMIVSQPLSREAEVPGFSYAFQPIVDVDKREVFSYEALIRGPAIEPAFQVLNRVPANRRYQFDRDSRVAAIDLAAALGLPCHLNLNFLPQGLYVSADSISSTLDAAVRNHIPVDRIILEVTEGEVIADHANFAEQLNEYRRLGLKVAIDDFGAGYSGLNLLADFQPDQVKIDMNLVRGIERHGPRQAIVRAVAQACSDLGIDVIAEGVETWEEYLWFVDQGVSLFQGYLFARPGFECLPPFTIPNPTGS
jgi:blue light- and temperature-responsive anti-repressor